MARAVSRVRLSSLGRLPRSRDEVIIFLRDYIKNDGVQQLRVNDKLGNSELGLNIVHST